VALLRGSYVERLGRRDEALVPGVLLARSAGIKHSDMFGGGGARCLFVDHLDGGFDLPPALFAGDHGYRTVHDSGVGRLVLRLRAEAWEETHDSQLILEGLAMELIGLASRVVANPDPQVPAWLVRARDRIHDESPYSPSVLSLAAEAGVHPSYFVRAFRRAFGVAPGALGRQLRVGRAASLLLSTELPLSQIATLTGFADQSHFGRVFKQVTGSTPAQYKAAAET
jgi:AraC family transcriptional regulator